MSYTVPQYEQPLLVKGQTTSVWYRYFQNTFFGAAPSNETTVSVGGSPFAYTAPSRGFVLIKSGTVSSIQYTRSLTTLTGLTSGIFPVSQGDVLTVAYTGLPSMTFFPQ